MRTKLVQKDVDSKLKLGLLLTSTDLDEHLNEEIAKHFEIWRYEPGDVLDLPGTEERPFRVLLWGSVLADHPNSGLQRTHGLLDLLGTDAVFATIRGSGRAPHSNEVLIAKERTTVLELEAKHFKEVFTTAGQPNDLFHSLRRAAQLQELAPRILEILGSCPELLHVPPRILRFLLDSAEVIEGQPPHQLLQENKSPDDYYVILDGSLELRRAGARRMQQEAPTVAGLSSLVRGRSLEFSVWASGAARLIKLKGRTFWEVFSRDPDFRSAVARHSELNPAFAKVVQTGSGVFVLFADPTLPADHLDVRVQRGLTDLLAERLAAGLCDRVLVLHVLPPGASASSQRRSVKPEPIGLGDDLVFEDEYLPWVEFQNVVLDTLADDVGLRLKKVLDDHARKEESTVPDITLVDISALMREGNIEAKAGILEKLLDTQGLRFSLVHLLAKANVEPPLHLLASKVDVVLTAFLPEQDPVNSIQQALQKGTASRAKGLHGAMRRLGRIASSLRHQTPRVLESLRSKDSSLPTWPASTVRVRIGNRVLEALKQPNLASSPVSSEVLPLDEADKRTLKASLDRWARGITGRRIGLTLGGGGMYGAEHLPLIQEFLKRGIPIDVIAGSSAGATVGAYFATLGEKGLELFQKRLNPILAMVGFYFVTSAVFEWLLLYDLGLIRLDETEIVFLPVVTDVNLGVEWHVRQGTYARGVRASGSLPPIGPTIIGSTRYIDGGVLANVPTNAVRQEGVGLVIASNCIPEVTRSFPPSLRDMPLSRLLRELSPSLRIQDLRRMIPMLFRMLGETQTKSADVVYRPSSRDKKQSTAEKEQDDLQLAQAVAETQSALRRLLRHPPSLVSLGRDKKTLVYYGWVGFAPGSANLSPRSSLVLDEVAKFLNERPDLGAITVKVSAETEDLANQRAMALKEYLEKKGVGTKLLDEGLQGREAVTFSVSSHELTPSEQNELLAKIESIRTEKRRAELRALARALTLAAKSECTRGALEVGRLLAIEAADLDPGPETDQVLRTALARRGWCTAHWKAGDKRITHIAFSAANTWFATGGGDGIVRLWDGAGPEPVCRQEIQHVSDSDPGIRGLDWSHDGRLLASAGHDHRLMIHRRDETSYSLTKVAEFKVGTWNQWGARFSPNAKQLLGTSGDEKSVGMWTRQEDDTWTLAHTFSHDATVTDAVWSPDGIRVASATANGSIYLWDGLLKDQAPRKLGRKVPGKVNCLAWRPQNDKLAVASAAGLWIFNLDGNEAYACKGHRGGVVSVEWSPDGAWLLSVGEDSTVRVWSAKTGHFQMILRVDDNPIVGARWHSDSKRAVTWSRGASCLVWHALTGELQTSLYGHLSPIEQVAWKPGDHSVLLTGATDGTLRLWSISTCAQVIFRAHKEAVRMAAYHPVNAELALTASADGSIYVWNPLTGEYLRELCSRGQGRAWAAWSPDGQWIAIIRHGETRPRLIQLEGWKPGPPCDKTQIRDRQDGHLEVHVQLSFSPDGKLLAVKHTKGVSVWDVVTGKLVSDYADKEDFHCIAWEPSPEGEEPARLAVSRWTFDGVSLHEAHTMKHLRNLTYPGLESERDGVWALAYHPEGRYLVTGSNNGRASLFDAKSYAPIQQSGGEALMLQHIGAVVAAAWSPFEGAWLATGDMQSVRIWRVTSSKDGQVSVAAASLDDPHQSKVCSLAWGRGPRGLYLASGGADGHVRIWEKEPGAEKEWRVTKRLEGHGGEVRALSISVDGRFLMASGQSGRVLVHPVDPTELVRRVAEIPGRKELTEAEWEQHMLELGPRRPTWPRPRTGPRPK